MACLNILIRKETNLDICCKATIAIYNFLFNSESFFKLTKVAGMSVANILFLLIYMIIDWMKIVLDKIN